MYGDMSVVRADAAALRVTAEGMRSRALALKAQAQQLQWSSNAAVVFRTQIDLTADDLGRSAASLDAAADALIAHASAVEAVKELIRQAEAWVADRLNDARTVVDNVVERVEHVAEGAVNGVVTVIGWVVDGAEKILTVASYTLFGREITQATVTRARVILGTVPRPPASGSKDWVDLKNLFNANGW